MSEDRNCLSWWFPRVEAAGLPVPRTVIIDMPAKAQECVWAGFDGEDRNVAEFEQFLATLASACEKVGYPAFLRTGHLSAKHSWKDSCRIETAKDLGTHVFRIAETSELAGMGLPYDKWAVREFLPIEPFGVCPSYGNMPVSREFRYFVEGGRVVCRHPYWPREALEQGGAPDALDYEALCRLPEGDELAALDAIAVRAGDACGGAWSVDVLACRKGWYLTDMAEAARSFHWAGCPHEGDFDV